MSKYHSDPNAEIIGQNVLAFLHNIQCDQIQPYLEKRGLTEIEPDHWYPLNTWLDVLSDISEDHSAMFNFVSIGMGISQTAVLPPGMENMSFEQFLAIFPDVYQMQHRSGDVGELIVEMLGDKHARIHAKNPFPIDLDYGALYGFAQRFLPPGTSFVVEYNPDFKKTHEHGVMDVTWE